MSVSNFGDFRRWNEEEKYLSRDDSLVLPGSAYDAEHLKLVQSARCGEDEYHIQSLRDEQYLCVEPGRFECEWGFPEEDKQRLPLKLMHFQGDESKATVFRFKKYERLQSLSAWRERLRIGKKVYVDGSTLESHGSAWYEGQVIGIKNSVASEFGKMVQVSYSGIDTDQNGNPYTVNG